MKCNNYFYPLLFLMIALLIFGFSARSVNVLEVAPVGHWTFDGEGNIAIDQSDYKSHGKLQGNPIKADGIVGKGCLELDGDGDYVEILENGKTPSQFHNLHKGSISIWFKARSIPKETSISPLFYYGNLSGCANMKDASNEGLVIEIAHGKIRKESQGVYFSVFNNPCELPTFCFDTHSERHPENLQGLIKEGEWYHFVGVVGENYNTGYLNGEEITYRHYNFSNADASQFFGNALSHDRMWFGKGFWDYANETYFNGYLDDIRIYDVPLNAEEVTSLYNLRNSK